MSFTVSVLLVFLCSCSISKANSGTQNDTQTNDAIYKIYHDFDKSVKDLANYLVKMLLPPIMKLSEEIHVSTNCSKNIFQLITEARKINLSALKLLDATAKVPPGLFDGNVFLIGDYDECLSTSLITKSGKLAFKGQYCLFEVRPALPEMDSTVTRLRGYKGLKDATKKNNEAIQYLVANAQYMCHFPMKAAVCVPSGCTSQDIDSIINYVAENTLLRIKNAYCDREYYTPTSKGKIAVLCFFSIFGLLAILGLGLDYYSIPSKNYVVKFLLCFSIKKNFPKLVSLKVNDESLTCMNGIRSLCVFYIILLHQYFFSESTAMMGHMKDAVDRLSYFADQIYANGYLTTEVFFFIGGFFNAYSRMKLAQKTNGKTNYALIVAHRLIRIYPTYILGILFIYLLSYSYGPIRTDVIQKYVYPCDRHWWRNIIFINNLFPQQDTCMIHGWYIAADMQMFLLSLFSIPVFFKHPKRGIIIHLAILVCGLLTTAAWAWYKQLTPGLIDVNSDYINRIWNFYTSPLPHIAPYFTGILIGYFLSTNKDFKISLVCQLVGWPLAAVGFISMLFMTKIWYTEERPPLLESVLYLTFSRFVYVSAVAWMVVCCTKGYGGVINYILSLQVWIPIAKLSYLMYILGPTIQLVYFSNSPVAIDSHVVTRIWQHIGDLGIIILLSLALSTFIEAPFFAIEKLIFAKHSSGETESPQKDDKVSMGNAVEDKVQAATELENSMKNGNLDLRNRLMKYV